MTFSKFFFQLLLSVVLLYMNSSLNATNYFVSISGNDKSVGDKQHPWKSLQKLNTTTFIAGDSILFEGGSTFIGTLHLKNLDGRRSSQIVVSSYGLGKAIINGENYEGVIVEEGQHFKLQQLKVVGNGRKTGNIRDGVHVIKSADFQLDSIEVSGFQHSGVHVRHSQNARITNVYAHDNGFSGIHLSSDKSWTKDEYENSNTYIAHCIAENNPGDPTVLNNHSGNGILASGVRNGIIEFCEAFNNGWDQPSEKTGGPVGIWIWDCTDFVIQHCIAHDNKTNLKAKDGGGFDLDGGVTNSLIQYCLSYNNYGSGYGLFEFGASKPWANNVIRYNVSYNDAQLHDGSVAIWCNERRGEMRNCEIYNNTFYNDGKNAYSLSVVNNKPGFNFKNNIFVYRSGFLCPSQRLEKTCELFQNNCYWNLSRKQEFMDYKNIKDWSEHTGNEILGYRYAAIVQDPQLLNPDSLLAKKPSINRIEAQACFALRSSSPLIDQGLEIKADFQLPNLNVDLLGQHIPIGKRYDIGAIEFPKK